MSLGVVNSDDFLKEASSIVSGYNSDKEELPEEKVIDINRGRGSARPNMPPGLRELVAGEALSGASPKELSKTFNVSESSISAYKHDATSTTSYNQPDDKLQKANNLVRQAIVGPAQSRLIKAIEAITDEKLTEASIKVASGVARDMSSVIKNLEGPDVVIQNNQVHVYRPRIKEEDDYEVIEVNE